MKRVNTHREPPVAHSTPNICSLLEVESDRGGPSILIPVKQPRVDIFRRFLGLKSVKICFITENARSHSAVLTGIRAAIEASLGGASKGVLSFVIW
jgi:hypothetical protein